MYDDDEFEPFSNDDSDNDDDFADHETRIEEAHDEGREEGFEEGREEGFRAGEAEGSSGPGFGCGCFFGIALTFFVVYMGWCSPYPFGH